MEIHCDTRKLLGRGGFAFVFEGTWGEISLRVAVKRIPLTHQANQRESENLKKLNHPNVIKLFHVERNLDFRYKDGSIFICCL